MGTHQIVQDHYATMNSKCQGVNALQELPEKNFLHGVSVRLEDA